MCLVDPLADAKKHKSVFCVSVSVSGFKHPLSLSLSLSLSLDLILLRFADHGYLLFGALYGFGSFWFSNPAIKTHGFTLGFFPTCIRCRFVI